MTTPIIDIANMWFSYNGEPVLRDVNLRVEMGEAVSVVGPNGGGKTTLLKLMLGLLRPTRGRVRIMGRSPAESRKRVGYVPQHTMFDARFPVNVRDVVLMGTLGNTFPLGLYTSSDRRAANEAMQAVGVETLARKPFVELSGGQRQRTLIARALVCEPELLLLDEPTANLDAAVESDFYDLLRRLGGKLSVVMVSHDMAFVSGWIGKVVCVRGTVAVHPTADLTGEVMADLYGHDVQLVRHDHDCMHVASRRGNDE